MEEIKIRFEKEYSINTDDSDGGPCHCCLKLMLPENENGDLVPILRDEFTYVFDRALVPNWGEEWDCQMSSITITSTDWDKLSQEVDKVIEETIKTLREVKKRNEDILNTIPKNETLTISL